MMEFFIGVIFSILILAIITIIVIECIFELGTGQWQYDYDCGTMGSWNTALEAKLWRLFNPDVFEDGVKYKLRNYNKGE